MGPANKIGVRRRQANTERPLHIGVAKPLTVGDCRRDDRMQCSVSIGTRGQTDGKKSGKNVIPMLFIRGEQVVLDQELEIAKTILDRWIVMYEIRRDTKDDFHLLEGN